MPARVGDQTVPRMRVGHIHGDGRAANLVGDGARPLLAHIDYEDVRAETTQVSRRGGADPGCRARDDRGLVAKGVTHCRYSPSLQVFWFGWLA